MRDSATQAPKESQVEKAREKAKNYYWRHRDEILARLRRRYREDGQYREMIRERARRRYHEDEAYREATRRRSRERYLRLKSQRRAQAAAGEASPPEPDVTALRADQRDSEG